MFARRLSCPYPSDRFPRFPKGFPVKKITLNVEELDVKSFETAPVSEARGTVHGMGDSGPWYCFGTMVCSALCPSDPHDP